MPQKRAVVPRLKSGAVQASDRLLLTLGARPSDLLMSRLRAPPGAWAAWVVPALLGLAGCSFGGVTPGPLEGGLPVHDAGDASNVGAVCQGEGLACGADLLCVSGGCREKCSGTNDECPVGSRCLFVAPDGGAGHVAVCVDDTSLECVACMGQSSCSQCVGPGCSFCPTPSTCMAGSCRNSCSGDSQCPGGKDCAVGICTGTGNHSKARERGAR